VKLKGAVAKEVVAGGGYSQREDRHQQTGGEREQDDERALPAAADAGVDAVPEPLLEPAQYSTVGHFNLSHDSNF